MAQQLPHNLRIARPLTANDLLSRLVKAPAKAAPKTRTLRNILPFLLAGSMIVELCGGLTDYPNQINVVYALFVLGFALVTCPLQKPFRRVFYKWLILPSLYIATFFVVSYFGVSFEASVSNHVLYLPLWLVNYASWFMVGYFYDERIFLKYTYKIGGVFGITSLVFALMQWLDPEQTRIISGLDLPVAMSVAATAGDVFWGGILVLISLFSLKKTVVACTLAGLFIVYGLKKVTKVPDLFPMVKAAKDKTRAQFLRLLRVIAFAVACAAMVSVFNPYMFATVQRLLLEKEDVIRSAADAEAYRLLGENFPYGTGFYTFGFITKETLSYNSYTASGDRIDEGMSLHNTFIHIALEGGLPIIIIVAFFYLNFARVVRKLFLFELSKPLAIVLITWVGVSILYGMFNQLHATRYFFGFFAYAFACYERYKREYRIDQLETSSKKSRINYAGHLPQ